MQNNPIPKNIFKEYDIRGIVGITLSFETVNMIGQAIAQMFHEKEVIPTKICVGRDGRKSGKDITASLISGLNANTNLEVIDIGQVTTPILYYGAIKKSNGNGIMVTGSHNPPEYNGLKIMISGNTLSGSEIQEIYKVAKSMETQKNFKTTVTKLNLDHEYIEEVVRKITLKRQIKIAVDCGNGIAGKYAARVFKGIGCKVEELFCEVDGNFPNHHPDPSQPKNLSDLINNLKTNDAEIGLAFDGDGDRLGVVTKSGEIIYPDRQLMLLAADVLSRNPGADIIYDVKCSSLLETWINDHGGNPVMYKTGHSLIKKRMRETSSPLSGEMSGHIFFGENWYGFDDGIYAGARLLEVLSRLPDATRALNALPNSINTPEIQIPLDDGENHTFIYKLQKTDKLQQATRIITIDGLRAEYAFGFGLARASNTTPVIVLRFEANDQKSLELIQGEFKLALREVDSQIPIPF